MPILERRSTRYHKMLCVKCDGYRPHNALLVGEGVTPISEDNFATVWRCVACGAYYTPVESVDDVPLWKGDYIEDSGRIHMAHEVDWEL